MIKLGGFGRIADYNNIKQSGFDYAELDIPEIEELQEKEFQAFCDKVHKDNFPVLTGARALPIAEPWFFTDRFTMMEYKGYLEKACHRANLIGMKKIILGNGKARSLIDESSIGMENRFIEFLRMFSEIAVKHELEVILEPLGPKYSNYINTLPEAVRIVHEVNMPNLFMMADLRHMYWSKEPLEDIAAYAEYVHHIHVDYPKVYPERPFPRVKDDFDYTELVNVLKKSGYQGTLTVEADIPEDWKCAYVDTVEVLKKVL
ncbi:sugar phosphate isomerase/epimerase family protein [Lacrimispora sp. 38-1]|uniref:sugar phosphate isomerase/epimerase family protein n=1 Tax=Lacrimispora sp. 38-1 TaxID=3125778 RepID=UPI003CF0B61B